jgi:MFS family permease
LAGTLSVPTSNSPANPAVSETFPAGLNNAYLFSVFNALSFQIVLSSPMILYAKQLGASATILGVIAGMMPLLVISQIPAAGYIARVGFRQFVYAGWGMRVMFIFAITAVPLTERMLTPGNRLALLLFLLFCFNLSRGISSCAWLPWITALVPSSLRGKYLSRDAAVQNLASCVAFLVSAACLARHPSAWQFSLLFGFSAVTGAISLSFLKRIPDVPIPEEVRASRTPVPWLEMLRFEPFQRLLRMVFGWSVAYGGITAFVVAFLRVEVGMTEGRILLISSVAYLGGLSSLWILGSRLDRVGSKPVLVSCFVAWAVVLSGWMVMSGGVIHASLAMVLLLQFLVGLLTALVQMSNTRLAMEVVPAMGRNHFFAIYSVVNNVTLGVAPIAWGLLIDAVGDSRSRFLGLEWNRFTVFFAGALAAYAATVLLARRLLEPRAVSMETLLREILIEPSQRVLTRLWPRG